MQVRVLALKAALIGSVTVPPSLAQDQSNQQQQQFQRELAPLQRAEEQVEKFLARVQPLADRFAHAMLIRTYSDAIVGG